MEMRRFKESEFSPGAAGELRQQAIAQKLEALSEHPLVENYEPRLLGEGTSQAVFVVKNQDGLPRNVVVKIHREPLVDSFRIMTGQSVESGFKGNLSQWEKKLQLPLRRERGRVKQLKVYFPNFILGERISVLRVPATKELLQALAPEFYSSKHAPSSPYELPTIVSIQEKAPENAFGPESRGLRSQNIEQWLLEQEAKLGVSDAREEKYQLLNQALVDGATAIDPDMIKYLTYPPKDGELFDQAAKDPQLHKVLESFVTSAIAYSKETGGILDIFGSDNIRIFPEIQNGKKNWRIVFVDAAITGGLFVKTKGVLQRMVRLEGVTKEEIENVEITLAYVRYINAMAAKLGMSDRLQLDEAPIAENSTFILQSMRAKLKPALTRMAA